MSANIWSSSLFQGVSRLSLRSAKLFTLAAAAALFIGLGSAASAATPCNPAYAPGVAYVAGNQVSENNINYTAAYWTQTNPATNNGAAGSGQPWIGVSACGSAVPKITPLFAPYVDMGTAFGESVQAKQQAAGLQAITLAFLDGASDGSCSVGWGGYATVPVTPPAKPPVLPNDTLWDGTTVQTLVSSMQASGVQVVISFGGNSYPDPAYNCSKTGSSASALQALYQKAITRYHVTMLDFDIEPTTALVDPTSKTNKQTINPETDQRSLTLRDQALVALKKANPNLKISYTLPVTTLGLDAAAMNVLKSAKADGLTLDTLNVMAMDFGKGNDDNGNMGQAAIDAATHAESNLISAGFPQATIGITPMIGENDPQLLRAATATTPATYYLEYFSWDNAQSVVNFAQGAGSSYVSRIGMWSLNRDSACPANTATTPSAPTTCSGMQQPNYSFSEEFEQF